MTNLRMSCRHSGFAKVPETESHKPGGLESPQPESYCLTKICACPSAEAGTQYLALDSRLRGNERRVLQRRRIKP